jgi:hypothetical protein
MIITRKAVLELVKLDVDMRAYVDLKTFYYSFTPALLIAKLELDVDYNRVYKPNLDKLIYPNNIVEIKALGKYSLDKYTINTPLEAAFTYTKVEKGEDKENHYCIFDIDGLEHTALREAELSAFEMGTYLSIAIYRKSDTLLAFPTQETLSQMLNTYQASISRSVQSLIDKGVLKKDSVDMWKDPVTNTPMRRNTYSFPKAIPFKSEQGNVLSQKEVLVPKQVITNNGHIDALEDSKKLW